MHEFENYDDRYEELIGELRIQRRSGKTETEKAADCFRIAEQRFRELDLKVKSAGFATAAAEIFFLRYVRPKYIALINYYSRLYCALQFTPASHDVENILYWKTELAKASTFLERHQHLVSRFKNSTSPNERSHEFSYADDLAYRNIAGPAIAADTYGTDNWIISLALAYEMYEAYITEQVLHNVQLYELDKNEMIAGN